MLVSCIGSMYADGYVPDMMKAMSITVNDLDQTKFTTKGTPYTVTSAVVDGKSFTATFNNETAGGWTTSRNDYVANPEGKAINFNVRAQLKKNTTVSLRFPCKGYLYVYGYGSSSTGTPITTLATEKIDDQIISMANTKELIAVSGDESTSVNAYVTQKFIALKGSATLYIDNQNSIYFYGFCFVPEESIVLETKPYAAYKDGTLTFRYDNKWEDSDDETFLINGGYGGWSTVRETTTTVVFDPSFASYTGVESTSSWFYNFSKLETVSGLGNLILQDNTEESMTSMGNMFYGCSNLTSIDTDKLNTENVESMGSMFYGCSSLQSLDVSNFNTKNVIGMGSMFYGCSSLQSLDVSNFNTQNVTNMSNMFYGCSSLQSLDVSNFNTQNVIGMGYMFYGCSSLQSLDVSNFNTQNVAGMSGMFYNCSNLTGIDVSSFDTQHVTSMASMFNGCSGLKSLNVSKFSTKNVTSIASMFYGCSGLSLLDLRSFSTESLTEATGLYDACKDDLQVLLPEGWNVDAMTRIAALEPIGNFLYNIYKDNHAVLAYRNEAVSISGEMVVPSKIEYQGEEYKVTKVGRISYAAETPERQLFTILSDEEYLKVTSITFEDGIEEIDDSYLGCYVHATSINIPKSVRYMSPGTYRMQNGRNYLYTDENGRFLSDVTFNVAADNQAYTSVDGVLYDKEMKTLLRCPRNKTGEFVVPNGIEALAWGAFRSCGQLESVVLPVGLKTVGEEAATSGVFNECYKLAKINIPSTVEYMSYRAFYTNRSAGLKEIYCYITEPKAYDDNVMQMFMNYSTPTLYVPYGTKELYQNTEGWQNFENIVELQEEITVNNVIAGDYMYTLYNEDHHAEMQGIVNTLSGDVVIPATVEYGGKKYSVTKVNSVTSSYYYDEENHSYERKRDGEEDYTKVTSMTFKDGIESISDPLLGFYYHCKMINIPKSVNYISPRTIMCGAGSHYGGYDDATRIDNSIGVTAFHLNDITFNVDIENGVYSSVDGVLYDKYMKTLLRCPRNIEGTFVVPDGVESIGIGAFASCIFVKEIKFPETVKEFVIADEDLSSYRASGVFYGCYSLEDIEIPNAVQNIGKNCFAYCQNLKRIRMPESLTDINTQAFAYMQGTEEIDWNGCTVSNIIAEGYSIPVVSLPDYVKNIKGGGPLFSSEVIPEEFVMPPSIETLEINRLFSSMHASETLNPLKKLYFLMDFMPDIAENFFGVDVVYQRVGNRVVMEELFPQTWADQCTLYVPENLVETYKAHAVWGKFPNIVGVEVTREIEPIETETTIAFAESDFVNADNTPVDLNNTVVNDTYFSINNNSNTDGYYDATDQCIVISKTTADDAMTTVMASELGSADFVSNYTGMVVEINGAGSIKIKAQTVGNIRLAVKTGNADAKAYEQAEKGDIIINYNVSENTYVYIYAVDANNQQQSLNNMDITDSENAVKVYSVTVIPSVTAIENVSATIPSAVYGKIYSIDGKQISQPQKGLNILKMSDGTTRKIVR